MGKKSNLETLDVQDEIYSLVKVSQCSDIFLLRNCKPDKSMAEI